MTANTRQGSAASVLEPQRYLTSEEAARVVRLSARTLERMRVEGTGPRYVKAGPGLRARVFYRPTDLYAWIDSNVFQSTSEYPG
jgi:hypothetical protein